MLIKARWMFVDEPRFKAGERGVMIEIGHKWVRFRDIASGRTCKIRRDIYDITKDTRLIRYERVKSEFNTVLSADLKETRAGPTAREFS